MIGYESWYVLHEDGKDDVILKGYTDYLTYYLEHIKTAGNVTKWMYHEHKRKVVINHMQIIRAMR